MLYKEAIELMAKIAQDAAQQDPAWMLGDRDALIHQIGELETGGHPDRDNAVGDNGRSLGRYQQQRAMIDDSVAWMVRHGHPEYANDPNRRFPVAALNPTTAAENANAYITRYGGPATNDTYEDAIRYLTIYNRGPNGYNNWQRDPESVAAPYQRAIAQVQAAQTAARQRAQAQQTTTPAPVPVHAATAPATQTAPVQTVTPVPAARPQGQRQAQQPAQRATTPVRNSYTIRNGDTIWRLRNKYKGTNWDEKLRRFNTLNPGIDENKLKIGQKIYTD